MEEMNPKKLQAMYVRMRKWYVSQGHEGVSLKAEETRAAGRALSSSLVVDSRILDEPVTY